MNGCDSKACSSPSDYSYGLANHNPYVYVSDLRSTGRGDRPVAPTDINWVVYKRQYRLRYHLNHPPPARRMADSPPQRRARPRRSLPAVPPVPRPSTATTAPPNWGVVDAGQQSPHRIGPQPGPQPLAPARLAAKREIRRHPQPQRLAGLYSHQLQQQRLDPAGQPAPERPGLSGPAACCPSGSHCARRHDHDTRFAGATSPFVTHRRPDHRSLLPVMPLIRLRRATYGADGGL